MKTSHRIMLAITVVTGIIGIYAMITEPQGAFAGFRHLRMFGLFGFLTLTTMHQYYMYQPQPGEKAQQTVYSTDEQLIWLNWLIPSYLLLSIIFGMAIAADMRFGQLDGGFAILTMFIPICMMGLAIRAYLQKRKITHPQ